MKLDEDTERLILAVRMTNVENAAVDALRRRIAELCEESRKLGQDQILDHYRLRNRTATGAQ